MKKAMSLLTATAMAATLLAGCGGRRRKLVRSPRR